MSAPLSPAPTRTPGWRGTETLLLYAAYLLGAWGINGMGAILLPLQGEFGVPRTGVAFYPTLYSSALVVVGLVGGMFVRRVGLHRTVVAALALTVLGPALMMAPSRLAIGIGAFVFGLGGALVALVIPVRFSALHGRRSARAITEANALGSLGAIVAPLAVALALTLQVGWRIGYAVPVIAGAAALLLSLRSPAPSAPDASSPDQDAPALPLRAVIGRWTDIPLAVGAEFSLVFWSAAALVEWHQVQEASAAVGVSVFLAGMAGGRIFGGPLMDRHEARHLVLLGAFLGLVGFALFWGSPWPVGAVIGLFVAGLGIAVLYPASLFRLVMADPSKRERAAQLGTLGIGSAVALAPLVLAVLADYVGIRWAYLVVPVLLGVLLVKNLRPGRGDLGYSRS